MPIAEKKKDIPFKIVNLLELSRLSKVHSQTIRNNILGEYSSLDANAKTQIANALYAEVRKFFKWLGFDITMKRL